MLFKFITLSEYHLISIIIIFVRRYKYIHANLYQRRYFIWIYVYTDLFFQLNFGEKAIIIRYQDRISFICILLKCFHMKISVK